MNQDHPSIESNEPTLTAFQNAQLTIEKEKIEVERRKGWLTAASIIVSALGVIAVYWGAQATQARDAEAAFQLTLAEIVSSSESSSQAESLIRALSVLFPGRVPESMQSAASDLSFGKGGKYRFLDLIATQSTPEGRCAIMSAYAEIFDGDTYRSPTIQNECTRQTTE